MGYKIAIKLQSVAKPDTELEIPSSPNWRRWNNFSYSNHLIIIIGEIHFAKIYRIFKNSFTVVISFVLSS